MKKSKKQKQNNTQEKLMSCYQLRVDKVRIATELKNGSIIFAVTSDERTMKETSYHASCYKNYTAICCKKEKEKKPYRKGKRPKFCI